MLSLSWRSDGNAIFMAGCDKQVKMLDVGSNNTITIGMHQQPIQSIV